MPTRALLCCCWVLRKSTGVGQVRSLRHAARRGGTHTAEGTGSIASPLTRPVASERDTLGFWSDMRRAQSDPWTGEQRVSMAVSGQLKLAAVICMRIFRASRAWAQAWLTDF